MPSIRPRTPFICAQCTRALRSRRSASSRNAHTSSPAAYSKDKVSAKPDETAQPVPPRPSVVPLQKLNYYWETIPPTSRQLAYTSQFFHNPNPNFLCSANAFREFPLSDVPEVAFLGRSNVGKSSLLNAVFGRHNKPIAHTSSKPGRTKTMNAFGIGGGEYGVRLLQKTQQEHPKVIGRGGLVVVDMPGYGKGSREAWGTEILKYLRERRQMRRAFLLVDAEHGLKPGDLQILDIMQQNATPHQVILSKVDKIISPNGRETSQRVMDKRLKHLREVCDSIRKVLQPHGQRGLSALGEILACSSEYSHQGERLGIDGVRWAVLQAVGLGCGTDGFLRNPDIKEAAMPIIPPIKSAQMAKEQ
ncbi:hypothetical protein K432DRAFT_407783 [Lepidopterella palustris CBS 459.81]|uniref:GTP-binding protein 8 n=1 Tax=Lepidopterella palustris CBS 459.81 TaxID=1314670 RepID=A0A8E2JBV0_9PEZI|nr:hypothetical protein K432DRAFT_407783 [Lepidopterella palustris CBS 459.81]